MARAAFPYKLYGGGLREDAISGLDPRLYDALIALYNAAPEEVQRELGITSGYRDIETQRKLWEASDKTGRTVAEPGKSKHNFGLAADLFGFGLKNQDLVSQATRDWVTQNAAKHGLYFPMDYEPWHIQLQAEQAAAEMKAAGYSDEQIRTAFLSSIAGTEAPGYNTLYGGSLFKDYSQHPNVRMPITSGPNKGDWSSAAGRYQFIYPTWKSQAEKLGLKDFSPTSQDAAAWDLAATTYSQATKGGDLLEALRSGDPGRINAAAKILSSQWTSLPGGIEQAGRYGTTTFADAYNKLLSGAGAGSIAAAGAGAGAGKTASTSPYVLAAKDKKEPYAKTKEALASALKGIGTAGGSELPEISAPPAAARVDAPVAPLVDTQQSDARRAQLAQILAQLNQGSLYA